MEVRFVVPKPGQDNDILRVRLDLFPNPDGSVLVACTDVEGRKLERGAICTIWPTGHIQLWSGIHVFGIPERFRVLT